MALPVPTRYPWYIVRNNSGKRVDWVYPVLAVLLAGCSLIFRAFLWEASLLLLAGCGLCLYAYAKCVAFRREHPEARDEWDFVFRKDGGT